MSDAPRVGASELAPVGPLGVLDRAFTLARDGGWAVLGPSWAGGGLLAATVIGVYYVERVEGIAGLRPLLALALVLAWVGRAWLLGRAARRIAARLHPAPLEGDGPRLVDVARTALVTGGALWGWLWLLVLASLGGAVGIVAVLPLFALRGLTAPSWIARSACTTPAGLRGFARAAADTSGRRGAAVVVEGMVLLGAAGLALNLYATTFLLVLVARSFIGLDVAALSTFLTPSNVFLQLVLGATALVVIEPLRAALSAVSFVDARVRAEGLDLRAGIEAAIAHARGDRPRSRAADAARAAVLLLALATSGLVTVAVPARAQDVPPPPAFDHLPTDAPREEPPPAPRPAPAVDLDPIDPGSADAEVAGRVDGILARPEFREFEDRRGRGLRRLTERLFEWMFRPFSEMPRMEAPDLGPLGLPGPAFFLAVGGLLLLVVLAYLLVTRRRERVEGRRAELEAAMSTDLRDRPPTSFLDDAATLAEAGRLREALRSLYLATLVSLDRRRLIAFEPHRTNWHYLRQMRGGDVREAFRHFTRLFDHKWYGREETTMEDYEQCRGLASAIVAEGGQA